jgi:hypothetical protein
MTNPSPPDPPLDRRVEVPTRVRKPPHVPRPERGSALDRRGRTRRRSTLFTAWDDFADDVYVLAFSGHCEGDRGQRSPLCRLRHDLTRRAPATDVHSRGLESMHPASRESSRRSRPRAADCACRAPSQGRRRQRCRPSGEPLMLSARGVHKLDPSCKSTDSTSTAPSVLRARSDRKAGGGDFRALHDDRATRQRGGGSVRGVVEATKAAGVSRRRRTRTGRREGRGDGSSSSAGQRAPGSPRWLENYDRATSNLALGPMDVIANFLDGVGWLGARVARGGRVRRRRNREPDGPVGDRSSGR